MLAEGPTRVPAALHRKLKAEARKKGLGERRAAAYVYGTLRRVEKKKAKRR